MNAADTGNWADFARLSRLKSDARASGAGAAERQVEALRGVARQFEGVFMKMMLESMRDASFGDPLFDSSQGDSYRDLFDHQLALELSDGGGIGIADMLVRQLSPIVRQATGAEPPADPFVSTADRAPLVDLDGVVAAAPASIPPAAPPATREEGEVTTAVLAVCREGGKRFLDMRHYDVQLIGGMVLHFVARTWPHAERVADELGVDPAVLVAQAALETGWGRHVMAKGAASSNNLFGIKADSRWDGPSVTVSTLEFQGGVMRRVRAPFRAYESLGASFDDYARFVGRQARYQAALDAARAAGGDGETYIRHLHRAGYATDPDYADKVVDVMRRTVAAVKNAGTRTL